MNLSQMTLFLMAVFVTQMIHAYECDTRELRGVSQKEMTSVSSKKFSQEYDQMYSAQFTSIENLKTKIPVGSDAREFYLSTRMGQNDVSQLELLRKKFQYDAVSQYLFDDQEINASVEHYTSLYKRGDKTFYLNRGRLFAVLEKKSADEFLLTRLNRSCQPSEIVSFSSLNHEVDSNVRYKVTPPFCRLVSPQNRLPASKTVAETQSYMYDSTDRATQAGILRDCDLLRRSPAVPTKRKNIASSSNR